MKTAEEIKALKEAKKEYKNNPGKSLIPNFLSNNIPNWGGFIFNGINLGK